MKQTKFNQDIIKHVIFDIDGKLVHKTKSKTNGFFAIYHKKGDFYSESINISRFNALGGKLK